MSKSAWGRIVFKLLVVGLLFTGFAQMPIFKRYYLADIPGFGWTADYYFNHVLHYVLAIALLALLGRRATLAFFRRPWGKGAMALALCWGGVVLTGLIRVMKNQPDAYFSPELVMAVDWGHLGFVMLLGLVSLATRAASKQASS
jgi:hypothetical protein